MAALYITEFDTVGVDIIGRETFLPKQLPIAEQKVTFTTSTQSSALNERTTLVRVQADGICSILFGANPTATTSNMRLTSGQTEYFVVQANSGLKIAAVTNT